MDIYVAIRRFVSLGKVFSPGQVIKNPGEVKNIKAKISDGKIFYFQRRQKGITKKLMFLEQKLGLPILDNVKAYLAEVDAAEEARQQAIEAARQAEAERIAKELAKAKAKQGAAKQAAKQAKPKEQKANTVVKEG